ncbi:GIY-YIG nuclease family protein [Candidatus Gracilibacteria bacterium]|nr:GIY-YIG nuclease family protein [Candidatus Gracilibacteria bacterium]
MTFYVYMLKCSDESLYIGSTNDLEKRLHAHNHLKTGARYTKQRRPVSLVYSEQCENISEARKREYALKQLTREKKLLLMNEQK